MEYNTNREHLRIPEYGRHVQKMVSHATNIEDNQERELCVKSIIQVMGQMNPHLRDIVDYKHKLWDHLFIMSDFKINVPSPFPTPSAEKLTEKPDCLEYPKSDITFSYYGKQIETMINTAISMKDGKEKFIITGMIANHMKKCYLTWNKSSVDEKTIFNHLNKLSDGKLKTHPDFKLIDDKYINIKSNKSNWKKKNNGKNGKNRFRKQRS